MPQKSTIEELPAGPTEGGGPRTLPHRPGIAELPVGPIYGFSHEAVAEVFRLRNRVHALESQMLAGRLRPKGQYELPTHSEFLFRNWPNELPEGGEGGGGVVVRPFPEIAELPPFTLATLADSIAQMQQRLIAIETSIAALAAQAKATG